MNRSITLFCSLIMSLLTSGVCRQLSTDKVTVVLSNIRLLAQTMAIRIQEEHKEISPNIVFTGLEFIPTDMAVEGLTAAMGHLNSFQVILRNLKVARLNQIRAETSNLHAAVLLLAKSYNCSLPVPDSSIQLEELMKNRASFQQIIATVALSRLERFLRKLIMNPDQLKAC